MADYGSNSTAGSAAVAAAASGTAKAFVCESAGSVKFDERLI